MVKLVNDRDRAEWLQCLQAAAVSASSEEQVGVTPEELAAEADRIFEEFRKRCDK